MRRSIILLCLVARVSGRTNETRLCFPLHLNHE